MLGIAAGRDRVEAVSSALATFGKAARAAIDASDEMREKNTANIFTEISSGCGSSRRICRRIAEGT